MTQQFNTITDALKWCLDHPGQKLVDKDGRKVWNNIDTLMFITNVLENGAIVSEGVFNMFPSDFPKFDLPTLSPQEPEKPTLNNLAALENWDWFRVTLPNGVVDPWVKKYGWLGGYSGLYTALSAGWPVEFGRDEV